MNEYDKAKTVIASLEEASPQLLAELAESGRLGRKLSERVDAFNLQLVRKVGADPSNAVYLAAEDSLMPMLTEFPISRERRPLTSEQRAKVEEQLDQWFESLPPSKLPAETSRE